MESKIPQQIPKLMHPPSSAAAIFADHRNLPLQGEMSMNNRQNDDCVKNPLMEAVQLEVEIEKKKIREEIMASEYLRRQKLEAEVRMELMMEKQLMGMRRFYGDLSVFDNPYNTSTSRMLMNSGFLGGYQGPLFHKNLLNVGGSDADFGDRLKLINTSVGGVDNLQQINTSVDNLRRIKPGPIESNVFGDGGKEQHGVTLGKMSVGRSSSVVAAQVAGKSMNGVGGEEVFSQAMPPCSGISDTKRKAETSEPSEKETSSVASKELKKKKKWYCALCEVSATSAGGLNLHLQGKKHKAKEASSKSCGTASNNSMDLTNNLMQSVEQAKARVQSMEEQRTQMKPMEEDVLVKPMEVDKSQAQSIEGKTKKLECSLCQVNATSEVLLRSHLEGKKHKAKEANLRISQKLISEAKGKGEVAHKWHCSLCDVSTASESNMEAHLQGKKHKAKAGLLPQDADSVDSNPTEKIVDAMIIVQGKSSEGDKGINEQTTVDTFGIDGDTSNNKGKKRKANNNEVTESEESEEIGVEMIQGLVKVWFCKICNEEASDEAEMANHSKSTKHMNMVRKNGGGLIVVSGVLKEQLESEKDT